MSLSLKNMLKKNVLVDNIVALHMLFIGENKTKINKDGTKKSYIWLINKLYFSLKRLISFTLWIALE